MQIKDSILIENNLLLLEKNGCNELKADVNTTKAKQIRGTHSRQLDLNDDLPPSIISYKWKYKQHVRKALHGSVKEFRQADKERKKFKLP